MSALDKQYVIKLDLNKETYNEDMEFSISDLETSDFWIDIKKSRKTIDFTDYNVVLYITKPNGNIRTVEAVFDMEDKMYYCNLTNETKNLLGNYDVQVIVNNFSENERLVVPSRIKYHVVNDILNDTYGNIEEIEDTLKENYDALLYGLESVKAENLTQDERISGVENHNTTQDQRLSNLEDYNFEQDNRFLAIERLNLEQGTMLNSIMLVNDTQDNQIQGLNSELDELTSTFNSNVESVRQELDEINNELDEKDLTLEDLTDITIQNTLGINNLEKQYEEKILEIETQTSEYISTSNTRLTNVESKNTTQDSRINSVESKYTSLNNVVDTVRVVNSNQTVEINNLKNRVTVLEQKISELETLIATLQGGEE